MTDDISQAPRFALIPRPVLLSAAYRDHSRVAGREPYFTDLQTIIAAIAAGTPLEARFYRSGIDRDRDELLATDGIKHLHLGGQNSDVLAFFAEYDDYVVLLEINSHIHFRTDPIGRLLRPHVESLKRIRADQSEARVRRRSARAGSLKSGLLPRRPKP